MRRKRTEQKLGELQWIKLGLCVALAGFLFLALSICMYQSAVVKPDEQKDSDAQTRQETLYAEQDEQPLQEAGSIAAPQKVVLQQTKSEAVQEKRIQNGNQNADKKVQEKEQETTYRLAVEDGCLQVYVDGTDRLYMATTIAYELLPEDVQEQVTDGKLFETEERLLEFLESYSS